MNKYTIKTFKDYKNQKKLLILNFKQSTVSKPGTEDKYARGHKTADKLLIELAKEKNINAFSYKYDNVLIDNNEIYIDSFNLKDFDYVIMGMMIEKSEIVNLILQNLDYYDIPYFNYGTPSDKGNKAQDMYSLTRANLPYIPTLISSNSKDTVNYIKSKWDNLYPVVCKIMNSSQGNGINKCDNSNELIKLFSDTQKPTYEDFRMVQKFIPNDGDYRILVFDNKIISSVKRVAKDSKKDFRNNISQGGSGFVEKIPIAASQIALDAVKVLKKDIAGVDLIQDTRNKKWYIMEVNSAPQYQLSQELSGINFPQILINKIHSQL
jgi:RimK family alpha-L-glutamate ligase